MPRVQSPRQKGPGSLISLTRYPFFAKRFRAAALHFCHKSFSLAGFWSARPKFQSPLQTSERLRRTSRLGVLLGILPCIPLGLCSTLSGFRSSCGRIGLFYNYKNLKNYLSLWETHMRGGHSLSLKQNLSVDVSIQRSDRCAKHCVMLAGEKTCYHVFFLFLFYMFFPCVWTSILSRTSICVGVCVCMCTACVAHT